MADDEIDKLKAEVLDLKARVRSNEKWTWWFTLLLLILSLAIANRNNRKIDTINDIFVTMLNIDRSIIDDLQTADDTLANHKEAIENAQDHIMSIYEIMEKAND